MENYPHVTTNITSYHDTSDLFAVAKQKHALNSGHKHKQGYLKCYFYSSQ